MKRLYIKRTREILFGSTRTDPDLVERMEMCGTPVKWGWAFCRIAGCQRCRNHRRKVWIMEAIRLFEAAEHRNLRLVTIMLDPQSSMLDVVAGIKRGKVAWRNILFRLRQTDNRARGVRIIGSAEVDWYEPYHVDRLSNYKRTQLESLGFDRSAHDVWFPHFHLIVDLAGLPESKLADALNRKWPGHRQTHIKKLDVLHTVEMNVARILAYATKHKHFYKIDPFHDGAAFARWSDAATVQYYNALFKIGGFSLLRFHLKPATEKSTEVNTLGQPLLFREPMPILF